MPIRFSLIAAWCALFACVGTADCATIVVPDDHGTITDAIQVSSNGDVIIVKPGRYLENVEFRGKAITLRSEQGPVVTIIDGGQSGSTVKFIDGEGPDSVIDGFTITNGTGTRRLTWDRYYGGGIRCHESSPVIINNYLVDNSVIGGDGVGSGGGIYCWYSSPLIENNVFRHNVAFSGGGICSTGGNASIRNNTFVANEAWYGGGLRAVGGGTDIEKNLFRENLVHYSGGGIACQRGTHWIVNNLITDNLSEQSGGGLYVEFDADARVVSNTIVNNIVSYPIHGMGGGISCMEARLTVYNTILYNNQADSGKEIRLKSVGDPCFLAISYSVIDGGLASVEKKGSCTINWGAGLIDADPLFADPASGDYHLTYGSPCRNAGLNHPLLSEEDFEGDPRISVGRVDIGADEFYFHLYHAGDVSPGSSMDLRIVGGPGMPVLLGHSLGIQDPPQPTAWGDLFLTMPPVWSSKIGTIPANGVLSFPITVPSFWNPGDEKYFQAVVGAPGGTYATLTNLETLEVE